jgi:hypothetical protein
MDKFVEEMGKLLRPAAVDVADMFPAMIKSAL